MLTKATACYLALPRDERVRFLAHLLCYLGQMARLCYVEAGNSEATAVAGLKEFNEMLHEVSYQLLIALGKHEPSSEYPQLNLMKILTEHGHRGSIDRDVADDVAWAVAKAFKDVQCDNTDD